MDVLTFPDPLQPDVIEKINESTTSNTKTYWKRSTVNMLNSTKEMLDEFFTPFNKQLATLFNDRRFLWEGY